MLITHNSNINRQNRIHRYPQIVSLQGVIAKESNAVSEELEKARDIITKYALQVPVSYRTEEA